MYLNEANFFIVSVGFYVAYLPKSITPYLHGQISSKQVIV
jgi:hypothetical protein